ncbi:MAG TPA: DegT/DnrJ/EryC1/StrS family aminotransferase [Armatimonadetes bacterium]|nr:DegT/DnrJ/EryC1/StrS family aminotransferase [Armatimonadota bacterium]
MAHLAINGGTPVRTKPFPQWPVYDERERAQLREVLESGVWGIGSPKTAEFERRWAEYVGTKFALSCTNGTHAIQIAAKAAGVTYGVEVIVPSYTFIATASAVLEANGIPVFVDIEPDTYNIDPAAVEAAITPHTRAVIPVYAGGRPPDLDAINEIARRHGILVIEDAAEAHGSEWRGQRAGSIGDLGTFSFQSSKNLTAGEGGAVTTNDERLFDLCYSYQNVGRRREGGWYEHPILGTNNRMTAWQAAILCAGLERLEEQTNRRHRNGAWLEEQLSAIEGIRPMRSDERITRHCYHLYMLRYDRENFGGVPRERFLAALRAEGIPCSSGWTPLHRQEAILRQAEEYPRACVPQGRSLNYAQVHLPVTERIAAEEAVWFSQTILLGEQADMQDIVDAIAKIRTHVDELRAT